MGVDGIVIFCVVIIPLSVLGVFLLNGKGGFLVAGFNTMSDEKKAKYDEKAVCRFAGFFVLAIVLWMVILVIGLYFQMPGWAYYILSAILAVGCIGGVIYGNTGKRFYKKTVEDASGDEDGGCKSSYASKSRIITIIISLLISFAVGVMFFFGARGTSVIVSDSGIQIKDMYGLSIDFSEISGISLVESSMGAIGAGTRTNGYGGFGDTLKGNFRSSSHGEILLFVRARSSPTIHIERDGQRDIFISFSDGGATRSLYEEILAAFILKRSAER